MASDERRKRVYIFVPFDQKHTGSEESHDNPTYNAQHWAAVRNGAASKNKTKEYIPVLGQKAFDRTTFEPGDRVYVHAHGGDWGELFARGGKSSGKEKAGIDKHTPTSLWASMNKNASFHALSDPGASKPLDLRIAACHSGDAGSFNKQFLELDALKGRQVQLKGKVGAFNANTGSITRGGTGRPSSKGLTVTSPDKK